MTPRRGAHVLTRPGTRVCTQFVSKFSTPAKTYWTDFDGDALRFPSAFEAFLPGGLFGVVEIKTLAAARAENLAYARAAKGVTA